MAGWLNQLNLCLLVLLGLGSGYDLRVVESSATLTPCSAGSLLEILTFSLCPSPYSCTSLSNK